MTQSTDAPSDRARSGEESDPVTAHVHAEAHPQGSEADADASRDVEYDAVLAAVPAPLAAGTVVALFSSLSVTLALGAGSLVAAGIVGWALFFASPV